MRNIIAFAALAALAACSSSQPSEAPETPKTAEEEMAGNYQVTMPDGTERVSFIAKDGTYTDTVRGAVVESGRWELKDGKFCSTPETEGVEPYCAKLSDPAADGTITATNDDGSVVKVKKIG